MESANRPPFVPISTHPLFEDLSGRTFSKMTVLGFMGRIGGNHFWWCRCECGAEKRALSRALKSGAIKACGHLSREKRTDEPFEVRNKKYQRDYRKKNFEKRAVSLRDWRAENPSKTRLLNRNSRYKKRFGLTLEEVLEIAKSQGGVCGICGIELSLDGGRASLAVDHCHETGLVRGILCKNCNSGIGLLRDDPLLLKKAVVYLESAVKKKVGIA